MICPLCNEEFVYSCPTKLNGDNKHLSHFFVNGDQISFYKKDDTKLGFSYSIDYFFKLKDCFIYNKKDGLLMRMLIDYDKFCELIKLDHLSFLNKIKLYQTFS